MSLPDDTSTIVPFQYENTTVRTIVIDGEPWFVLTDLCKVLDIANVGNVAERLDDVSIRRTDVENSRGQMRQTIIVNESGMYEVVIRSDKPEAVTFRRWITGTVLPEIRRTGSYGTTPALTEDEIVHQALQITNRKVKELEAAVAEMKPKADAYTQFLDGDGTYAIGAAAKILGRSQNRLFKDLRNAGVLIAKGSMRNTPYQRYMHHFVVKGYDYERSDGSIGTSYTTRVQPSGLGFVARKLGLEAVLELGGAS